MPHDRAAQLPTVYSKLCPVSPTYVMRKSILWLSFACWRRSTVRLRNASHGIIRDMIWTKRLIILCLLIALTSLAMLPTSRIAAQDAKGDLFSRINTLRGTLGLSPYRRNAALDLAAQRHSEWMATTGIISHTQTNGSTPRTRAGNAGYSSTWVSENIYGGTNARTDDAWNFWINSSIHYRGLTNARYQEIGIGVATSTSGTYFTLVFGVPAEAVNNPVTVPNSGNTGNTGSDSAPAQPPSFVVGVDNIGNIMHEIQEGDTVGDIALIYGYTWDDVEYMLEINGMTLDDLRILQPGEIFLVPPHAGTYTPTAPPTNVRSIAATNTLTATAAPSLTPPPTASETIVGVSAATIPNDSSQPAVQPSLTPVATITSQASVPGLAATADVISTDVTQNLVAVQPSITVSPVSTRIAQLPTNTPLTERTTPTNNSVPAWIVALLAVQSVVIIGAAVEYIRRSRRA